MKQNKENRKEEFKKLKGENEEIKKKLTEDHGAFFGSMSETGNNLPPEMENQFLNHIMAFENAYKTAKYIELYDFLQQPHYRKVEELTDDEITIELDRVMKLMNDKMVYLHTLCEVADRELYRFITEELFFEEKSDMEIPGMRSNYTYEEFHPNHEYDIRNHFNEFIQTYLDKKSDYYSNFLTSEAKKQDWHLHFRQAFSSFHVNEFSITDLNYDTEKATVQFNCDFVGKVEGSAESLRFLGNGTLTLLFEWDYWTVDTVKFPQGAKN